MFSLTFLVHRGKYIPHEYFGGPVSPWSPRNRRHCMKPPASTRVETIFLVFIALYDAFCRRPILTVAGKFRAVNAFSGNFLFSYYWYVGTSRGDRDHKATETLNYMCYLMPPSCCIEMDESIFKENRGSSSQYSLHLSTLTDFYMLRS